MRSLRWVVVLAIVGTLGGAGQASAQSRRVARRPLTRSSVVVVAARPYYSPYYYSPWYGFGAGWYGGWYPSPYYWQYPYPYGRYYRDYDSSARLQVQPRNAEVFIDGYFVGVVDEFDGWLQRLNVEPGEHTLEIYLAGHRTFRQDLLFRPGVTLKIEHVMQPLAAGDAGDTRPIPSPRAARPRDPNYPDQNYPERPGDRPAPPRRSAPPPPPSQAPRDAESRDYGSLAVRVQPMDAQLVVDGETWQSPEAGSITLQLTEGAHRVEVRKDGFRTYSAEIRVRRGETSSLNVSLSRQD
jgi:hypothetical protein